MSKFFTSLCLFIMAAYAPLWGKILETARFDEIDKYVTPKTLVILDIDDTLLVPTQTLGTDVWFLYQIKQHEAKGMDHFSAFNKALGEWEAVRHITNVKIVEEGTPKIIEEMQKNKITVMGLTTQGLTLAVRTIQQLRLLNIDLSKSAPSSEDHYFMNQQGVLYHQGVLFTAGTPKGMSLLKLFEIIGYFPSHIVFINDKATHLLDVEDAVKARNIDFIGLRYSYCDSRIAQFNKEVANAQWKFSTLDHLLSDQEAQMLINLK